jgi:mRNA-degrading endonuclease HigB of HigAB toxin-antitoxin module
MKIFLRAVLILALVAFGFWLWTILFPGPEKIIRGQLAKVARDVSFSQDENNLLKIAHAQSVAGFFSTNVEVRIAVPGGEEQRFVGRDEITQAAMASRQAASSLDVKFPDVKVTVAPDKNSATADVTVDADVSGEKNAIVQEVKFTFEKIAGKWLITKVETVRTLSEKAKVYFAIIPLLRA